MQFLKKSVRGLSKFFFICLIFNLAVVSALVMTFNSPEKIEKSLNDSGVYSTFVSGTLQEVQKQNDKDNTNDELGGNDVPVGDPAIIAAANKAFPPQLLQDTTENVLDGTYKWLKGEVKTPDYTIDFTAAKQTFAQGVGDAAEQRLNGLKVCTAAELKAMGTNADVDAFKVTCRPPSLNVAAEKAKIISNLANSKDFLGTPKLTAQNMQKDDNGKTFFENASQAPTIYKWVNASPWLIAVLALLAGIIIFFLSVTKRRGVRSLATIFTVVGALLTLTNLGTSRAFDKLNDPSGKLGEAVKGSFQQTIIKALDSISHSIESIILWFGIAYLVIGIVTLIILRLTKPKNQTGDKPSELKGSKTEKPEKPAQPESKPAPKPPTTSKPAPKPKFIQG